MARYASLGHRFWVMFSLLVAAISVVTALGVYAAASSSRQAFVHQELEHEAAYFERRLARDPGAPLPDSWLIRGYRQAPGAGDATLPAPLRGLAPGYHQVRRTDGSDWTAYVSDTTAGRLYLLFNNEGPTRAVMLFGLIPVVLVVLIIYLATWITYRASRRALSPVVALADVVRHWDPDQPDPAPLAPGSFPTAADSDVEVLVTALYSFAYRLDAFVERERNFTRDASHELRTPLTVMKIAVDVLAEEDMSPFAQRSLARIRRSIREMETLIETFLVLARESGSGLRDEDFLVNDMVASEVARYRELMAGKPVELRIVEHARFALHAPPRVFAVLVGNLIRNACLYTKRGSVTVEVEADALRVIDTGTGMSEDELERVFQAFYRGSQTGNAGHGIGLAIVRRIADRYGWRVTLTSELGRGTVAGVQFPLAQPPDRALPGPSGGGDEAARPVGAGDAT